MYSLASVCRLAGIRPSTLRSWERRYGLFQDRRPGDRREYTPADVEHITRLARLAERGHPIGVLAGKSPEALAALEADGDTRRRDDLSLRHLTRLIAAAEANDIASVRAGLGEALAFLSPLDAISDVLSPFLAHVGQAWVDGRIEIFQEHLVTAATRQALMISAGFEVGPRTGRRILFATLSGEQHEMGLLMAWRLARGAGWDGLYLGVDLPAVEAARAAEAFRADVLALSLTQQHDSDVQNVTSLSDLLPARAELWIGASEQHPIHQLELKGVRTFRNYREFYAALR